MTIKKKSTKQKDTIMLVAVDIGNSRIKIKTRTEKVAFEYDKEWEKNLSKFLDKISDNEILTCYSSVNKYRLRSFLKIVKNYVIQPYSAGVLAREQRVLKYQHIKGIGIDRALGMIGAITHYKPPFITVDCGTAVTINAVNKNYECLGGAILPGIDTQIKALKEHTAGLKKIEISTSSKNIKASLLKKIVGKDTSSAISSGVIFGVTASIRDIVDKIIEQEFKGSNVKVILTGGGMDLINKVLKSTGINFHLKKDLVLDGLMFLLAAYVQLMISSIIREIKRKSEPGYKEDLSNYEPSIFWGNW